jgi:hypothetical protein
MPLCRVIAAGWVPTGRGEAGYLRFVQGGGYPSAFTHSSVLFPYQVADMFRLQRHGKPIASCSPSTSVSVIPEIASQQSQHH